MSLPIDSFEGVAAAGSASLRPAKGARPLWLIEGAGLACAAIAVVVLSVRYHLAAALFNQYDDSYITFRYAVNLATGKGLVFNVGQATDAASSFLYTVVLALFYRIGFHDLEGVSTVIGIASLAGTMLCVYWSCLARTAHLGVALFLACVVGYGGMLSGWATSGMETCFFTFLVSAVVHRLFIIRRLDWGATMLVCAAALTRLEGVLLVGAFVSLAAAAWCGSSMPLRRRLLAMTGATVATVLGFVALKLWLYGTPLPHAFLFKYVSRLYRSNPAQLWKAWQSMGLGVLVLGTAGLFLQPRRLASVVMGLFVAISVVSVILGPAADFGRYSVHLFPVLAVLSAVPLAATAYLAAPLAVAVGILLGAQTVSSFNDMVGFNQALSFHQACRKQVGRFIENNLKPTTPILSSDIGAIAYAAPSASFIDTIALTSADILARRSRGEGVDDILQKAREGLVADTCHNTCTSFPDYSAHTRLVDQGAWQTLVPPTAYGQSFGQATPLFSCTTPDGLIFAVSRFGMMAGGIAAPN